jgi:membrane-associated phospholipid phosphatase
LTETFRRSLLSTWTIAASCSLAIAWFVDESFGYLAADSAGRGQTAAGTMAQIGWIGAPPVAVAIALASALWFAIRNRPKAAAAIASVSAVTLAFGARTLFTADSIGWDRALETTFIASRTIAATSIALVLAVVLHRERILGPAAAFAVGLGAPALVGLSRVALRVHSVNEIAEQWAIGLAVSIGIVLAYLTSTRTGDRATHEP